MLQWFKSYTSFSRPERLGLISLFSVLILLLVVRWSMHLFVHPDFGEAENKRFSIAWDSFKLKNTHVQLDDSIADEQLNWLDKPGPNNVPMPDTININIADSATLVRLKGIGPVIAGKIVRWRKVNGRFKSIDELLKVHHIPDATFSVIRKHLRV